MEYRSFDYTNEFGQVELKRGSLLGVAISWVIIQSLKIALLLVVAGLGYSIFKYFEPSHSFATPQPYSAPFASKHG